MKSVRALMAAADLVIAVGTEMGPTDYDLNADGGFAMPVNLLRIDIDAEQLDRLPAKVRIEADSAVGVQALLSMISDRARASDTSKGRSARRRMPPRCPRRDWAGHAGAIGSGGSDPRRVAGVADRRRFDAAGLCGQPLLRSRPAWRMVQLFGRLWRAGLWPAGGNRRGDRAAICSGRLLERRWRVSVHAAGTCRCR